MCIMCVCVCACVIPKLLRDGAGDRPGTTSDTAFLDTYAETFPEEKSPSLLVLDSLRGRALVCAMELREAVRVAWGPAMTSPVDCLFALERLGCPYRNIRGVDISAHTEPIDALWSVGLGKGVGQGFGQEGEGKGLGKRVRARVWARGFGQG